MRILYSAPDIDLNAKHGGASHVIGATDSLAGLGNEIYLIVENGCFNNAKIHFIKIKKSFVKPLYCFFVPFLITLFLCIFGKIDMVYERARIFGGGAILAGKIFGKKTIYEMIEPYTEAIIYTNQVKEKSITKKIIDLWHNYVIVNSDFVTITHNSFLKSVPEKKALIIKTGADLKKFNPSRKNDLIAEKYGLVKGKTLFYAGSFAKWHMLGSMIAAVSKIAKINPMVKLLMVGDGEKSEECRNLIRSLKLENNIFLTGKVDYDKMAEYINASDICFALFDRNYGPFRKMGYFYSPIKTNEYMACGKPVIASNIGTLKDSIRNGINGFLVDESNITEIVSAIKKLLQNKNLSRKIGKNNLKDAQENCSWDVVNSRILNHVKCLKKD